MRYYIVSWDCEGVEFLKDITADHPDRWAEKNLFSSIKESKKVDQPMSFSLTGLLMRARVNSQRHYEVYVFTSEDDIDEEAVRAWSDTDPQGFANWVREYHTQKLWDDRAKKKPVIV